MPAWLRRLRARWRYRHFQDEVAREIETHRAMTQSALERSGVDADAARAHAARALGNVTLMREEARSVWIASWLQQLAQDARYAGRLLRRQPAFSASVVLVLALGCGLVAVLFSAVYGTFLRPWPARDPASVVIMRTRPSTQARDFTSVSIAEFRYLETHASTVTALTMTERFTSLAVSVRGADVGRARLLYVSRAYFDLLGWPMAAGRSFTPDEHDYQRVPEAAVLSRGFWRRHFNSDASVVGQPIQIGPHRVHIAGVSSLESFIETTGSAYDIAMPLAGRTFGRGQPDPAVFTDPRRQGPLFTVAARLPAGMDPDRAAAELTTLSRQFRESAGLAPIAMSLTDTRPISRPGRIDEWRAAQLAFLALVLVQVLACANVGNLLLARGLARRREMAVRQALGAGRRRLVRQLLMEAALISVIAGVIALALAYAVPSLVAMITDEIRREAYVPGAAVLLFCLGLTVWTTLVCGLAPALRSTGRTLTVAFSDNQGLNPQSIRLRRLLLASQVALATVLLVGAGLLTRAVAHAAAADPGFLIHELQAIEVRLTGPQSIQRGTAFFTGLRDELETAAPARFAFTDEPPLSNSRWSMTVRHPHEATGPSQTFRRQGVSPNYFEVAGVAIVAGRPHGRGRSDEVVVSQSAARQLWPDGSNPIGKRLLEGRDRELTPLTVVGVAEDVAVNSMTEFEPSVYKESSYVRPTILVRDSGPTASQPVKRIVASLDAASAVRSYALTDNIRESLSAARIGGQVAWSIGALGLLLATIGAFGVFAYAVEERKREIGIRLALGARRAHVIRAVWATSQRAMLSGLIAGGALAAAGAQLLRRFLHGLSPFDPIAYLQIAAILGAAAALATWLPARRAARVDPAVTLRTD